MGEDEEPDQAAIEKKSKKGVKTNQISEQCIFYSAKEGDEVGRHLQQLQRVHIPVPQKHHHCYFDAILCQVDSPLLYTAYHLRLQTCMYMIQNYQECLEILQFRLVGFNTCMYKFIERFIDFNEWGEEALTPIISKMWNTPISILNIFHTASPYNNYGSDTVSDDIVLIYNGENHYSGTGNFFRSF